MKISLFCLMLASVLISAIFVVMAQHRSRTIFVEIQALEKTRNELNEEWSRLLLEQSTWATDGRIETVSRNELEMVVPDENIKLVVD